MPNNHLITDNWNLDISRGNDDILINKNRIYCVIKKCRIFISMINTSSVLANYFNQARLTLGIKRTLAGDCEIR